MKTWVLLPLLICFGCNKPKPVAITNSEKQTIDASKLDTTGMTFTAGEVVNGPFVFNSDSGGAVCGLDTHGKAFLGNNHTWKECSERLMKEIIAEYPRPK